MNPQDGTQHSTSTSGWQRSTQEFIQERNRDIEQSSGKSTVSLDQNTKASSAQSISRRTVTVVKGGNGFCWVKEPPSVSSCTAARDIVHRGQKPKSEGKIVQTPIESFRLFLLKIYFKK